jgi:hypothetical protein
MNDLLEIVEDLETLYDKANTPSFDDWFDVIFEKWSERAEEAEAFMERQYNMEFS